MKRMHCGLESADFTWWDVTAVGTNYVLSAGTSGVRTGTFGMEIIKNAAAGPTVGAYAEYQTDSGNPVYWSAIGVDGGELLLHKDVGESKTVWARCYFKINAHVPSGSNAFSVIGLFTGTARGPAIVLDNNAARRLSLYNSGAPVGTILTSASLATWYRLELNATTDLNGDGTMTGYVYLGDGTVPLRMFTAPYTLGTASINRVRFGIDVINGTSTAAADYNLDDFAVNDGLFDGVYQVGIHNASPFTGACLALVVPNAAGSFAEWTTGPVPALTNWQMVDEWPPDGDTTYCTTLTAGTVDRRDSHAFPNLGAVGYTIKSIAMMVRHSDSGGGFPGHRAGIRHSGVDLENNIDVTGSPYTYRVIVVGEKAGGGPWTNAAYDAAEMMYRRDSSSSVLSSRRVTAVNLEAETDNGVINPAIYAALRPGELQPANYPPGVVGYGEKRGTLVNPPVIEP